MTRGIIVAGALTCVLAVTVIPCGAQVPDHLKCQEVKDPSGKREFTADLGGLALEPGCVVKLPAKLLCEQATTANEQPPNGAERRARARGTIPLLQSQVSQASRRGALRPRPVRRPRRGGEGDAARVRAQRRRPSRQLRRHLGLRSAVRRRRRRQLLPRYLPLDEPALRRCAVMLRVLQLGRPVRQRSGLRGLRRGLALLHAPPVIPTFTSRACCATLGSAPRRALR